jgi:hypothetical protein
MDNNNTNTLSQSILQTISQNSPSYSTSSTTESPSVFSSSSSDSQGGWFDSLQSISITTWLLIILILAFLGFNLFVYLAKGTDLITKIFSPILKAIFGTSLVAGEQIVDVSAEGGKAVIGETAQLATSALTAVQNITPNQHTSQQNAPSDDNYIQEKEKEKEDVIQKNPLNQSINQLRQGTTTDNDYYADNADSSIQGGGKAGWCYIGQDRGFRSCAEVGVNDVCMSGDIFPTQEICINPSLRR